jgi:hypothetical protein
MICDLITSLGKCPVDVPCYAWFPRKFGHGDNSSTTIAFCIATTKSYDVRAQANQLLAKAWATIAPASVTLPLESLRRGPAPRAGAVATDTSAKLWWSTSISHSAAGPVLAAGVAVQPVDRTENSPGITIGVDIEPMRRFVHPGVARLISARAVLEAPIVSSGAVPVLAVACVKEAIYKADRRQSGRTLADYAWIQARRTKDGGWCGIAEAVGDCTQQFIVRLFVCYGNWVALALAER